MAAHFMAKVGDAKIAALDRYLAIPTVAKHRVLVRFTSEVLPNHQVVVFARQDDSFFGVLHSRAHAARDLNDLHERWLNPPDITEAELKKRTLTNLYNARPAWLTAAHATLDRAVWAAYGWEDDPVETTDEEFLTRLLALNQERSA